MDEVSVAELLRSLNRSAEPDPGFREDLFAALHAEYDGAGGSVATFPVHAPDEEATLQAQPRTQQRGWSWQWAAVAFVVVGVLGLLTYLSLPGSDDLVNPPQGSTALEPGTTAAVPDGRVILGADQIRLPEGMHPLEMTADDSQLAFLVSSELQPADEPPLEESELIIVDRSTGDIVVRTSLGGAPNRLALDQSAVWVTHFDTGAVTLVDRNTGETTLEIALQLPFDFGGNRDGRLFLPNDIVVGDETVWVSTARGAVASIHKATGQVEYLTEFGSEVPGAQIQGPAYVSDLEYLNGDLWIGLNLGGVTLLDPATGAMTNVGLAVLDHGAERIEEVDGRVYAVGNRLLRTDDGELPVTGSYTVSEESALTLLDADTGRPQASVIIDGALFVGDVGGDFGAVSDSGLFYRLDPELASQDEPTTTDVDSSSRLVSLDGEAWTMDSTASQLLRVQPTGQLSPSPDSDTVSLLAVPSPGDCGNGAPPAAVSVGGNLHRSAVGASSIWVSDWNTGTLTQLDVSTLCTRAQLTIGGPFSSVIDLVADGDTLWVADFSTGSVHQVSGQGTVSRTIPDVRAGAGMVIDGTNLYVVCCGIGEGVGDDPITRIDTTSGEATVIAGVDWSSAAANGHGSLWVGSYITHRVVRLDPTTGDQIAEIELPEGIVSDIAVTDDSIWVASATALIQIDPSSNQVIDTLYVPGAEIPSNVQIEERADGLLWIYGRHFQPFLLQPATRTTIARMEAPPDSVNSTEQGLSFNSTERGLVITDGGTVAILNDD